MIILDDKQDKINWTEIGNTILKNLYEKDSTLFDNYEIFNGLDNLYPITPFSLKNGTLDSKKNIIAPTRA